MHISYHVLAGLAHVVTLCIAQLIAYSAHSCDSVTSSGFTALACKLSQQIVNVPRVLHISASFCSSCVQVSLLSRE